MTHLPIPPAGERKQVTAVFVDLENFSAISGSADAEDLQSWLEDYYRQTREIFAAGGGEITEYLGDGVVAIFGLARSDELSADRAVEAALRCVRTLNLTYQGKIPVRLRAGVATGEVAVRAGDRRDGLPRVTGAVTTLAERIQTAADPGTVVIAEDTRTLLRGRFEARALDPRPLKGFADPVPLYEVIGRLPAAVFDLPEGFVGRAREMATVFAADGPMLVVGEAGIGKTAFVSHLASQFAAKTVFQGDAISAGSSYQPFRDWLLDSIGQPSPGFAALSAAFPTLDPVAQQALGMILGLAEGQVLLTNLSSLALKAQIEAALWQAIIARQDRGLLLFEDLHWFDIASFGVLTHIFASPEARSYRLILTSREDAKLGRHLAAASPRTLALGRLPEADAVVLLDRLSPDMLDDATRRRILDRAGGVPLFLQHLVRRGAGSDATIPATLMDLLGERIDATAEAKPLLQRASALGRTFSLDMLRALDPDGADPLPLLRAAARAGVVTARPPRQWEFCHALLAQAAYHSMLRRTREALHARIADLLITRFPQVLQRDPALLADHQHKARQMLPATQSYLKASQWSLVQGAFADAEAHARAALAICPELDPALNPGQRSDMEIASHTAIGSILMQVQGFTAEPVRRAFDAVLDLASAQPVRSGQTAPALFGSFSHAIIAGDDAKASRFCRLLEDMAATVPDDAEGLEVRLAALAVRNCASFYEGSFATQFTSIAAIRPLYRLDRHAGMIARYGMDIFAAAQMFETPARAICGQTDLVAGLVAETDAHQAALSLPVMQPYALIWGAVPLFYAGQPQAALARLRRGLAVAEAQGAAFWQITGRMWEFVMDPALAADPAGIDSFAQGVDLQRAIGANVGVPYFAAVHSERLAAAGRHDEAWIVSSRAVTEARESGLLCWFAEVLRLHARNCRATRRTGEAEAALAQAVEVAVRQGAMLWTLRALLDRIAEGGSPDGLAAAAAAFPASADLPELHQSRAILARATPAPQLSTSPFLAPTFLAMS
jgi:class 3 adenylate cyclase